MDLGPIDIRKWVETFERWPCSLIHETLRASHPAGSRMSIYPHTCGARHDIYLRSIRFLLFMIAVRRFWRWWQYSVSRKKPARWYSSMMVLILNVGYYSILCFVIRLISKQIPLTICTLSPVAFPNTYRRPLSSSSHGFRSWCSKLVSAFWCYTRHG